MAVALEVLRSDIIEKAFDKHQKSWKSHKQLEKYKNCCVAWHFQHYVLTQDNMQFSKFKLPTQQTRARSLPFFNKRNNSALQRAKIKSAYK